MHFLLTGHTGFKGSWLTLLLKERGHKVSGISLDIEKNSLFNFANISSLLSTHIEADIRDFNALNKAFQKVNADVVVHLAAQSIVSKSYIDPITTFETNVNGTLNVLKASQNLDLQAQLIVTTDKVYSNREDKIPFKETDPLGGRDPYSASKAMADLATQSWLQSFENPPTAIARAGNVIGGGDSCSNRLVPDLIHSIDERKEIVLRSPNAFRPWQHVLDCLNGYLMLIDHLISHKTNGTWNFGPDFSEIHTVEELAKLILSLNGTENNLIIESKNNFYESKYLSLDSTKARVELGWKDKLDFFQSVKWTVDWHNQVRIGKNPLEVTKNQIVLYEGLTKNS